jgi:hypothetical protein
MVNNNYTFTFESSKDHKNIFETLLNVRKWWSGLFEEKISGSSDKINDEFTFLAGGGVHYTKQKLIELVPHEKIVWQVTESNLTFLQKQDEWTNTKICFEITRKENKTHVTFTHLGLAPKFECYNQCAGAWTQYLENLAVSLK